MNSSDPEPLILRDVVVGAKRVDVLIRAGVVERIGHAPFGVAAKVLEGKGGTVIPGLHDHHIHLLATAAASRSVDCTGMKDLSDLRKGLQVARPYGGWIRAVGYDEETAGALDRHVLDIVEPERPVRVQHRSGALWVLNSAGLELVRSSLDFSEDVETDVHGNPNGRLWRYDRRLARSLRHTAPSLAEVGAELAGFGVTGVTDATPALDDSTIEVLCSANADGSLPQRLTLLGAPHVGRLPDGIERGPHKIHLRDHDLPAVGTLRQWIDAAHSRRRPVAVHCVTAEALILTIAALRNVGPLPGDRIEHASVVPPPLIEDLRTLGLRVVTQPSFIEERGDSYLESVTPAEQPWLYPWATLRDAGVNVAPSSDAPHGTLDPWRTIASASARRTAQGQELGPAERVSRATALAGYLSPPDSPGGAAREVAVGIPADLCLLRGSLAQALKDAPTNPVRLTMVAGRVVNGE